MIRRSLLPTLLLFALTACSPEVNVGTDQVLEDTKKACWVVTLAPVACPPEPWGLPVSFDSVESLERRLHGKWAFCGGQMRYSGRGPLKGFPRGSGIEFWSDAGQLRFAFLQGSVPPLGRTTDPAGSGSVRLLLDAGRGRAVLRSDDGLEAVWHAAFFEGQAVLQNDAFDVWNFVSVE